MLKDQFPLLNDKTYLMTAAIGAIPPTVYEAMNQWNRRIQEMAAVKDHVYFELVLATLSTLGRFLNTAPENVTLTSNTSLNMSLLAIMLKDKSPKREIVTFEKEFPSTTLPWIQHTFEMKFSKSYELTKLLGLVTENTAAVVVSHVQFLDGHRIDLEELSKLCQSAEVPLIINATQSIGAFEIDLKKVHCLALSASGHKWLCAGMGAAALYLHPDFRENCQYPIVGWGSVETPWDLRNDEIQVRKDASVLTCGSISMVHFAAWKAAIEWIEKYGQNKITETLLENSDLIEKELRNLNLKINSDRSTEARSGSINFEYLSKPESEVLHLLEKEHVYINGRRNSFRVSSHYYNDEVCTKHFGETLRKIIST